MFLKCYLFNKQLTEEKHIKKVGIKKSELETFLQIRKLCSVNNCDVIQKQLYLSNSLKKTKKFGR